MATPPCIARSPDAGQGDAGRDRQRQGEQAVHRQGLQFDRFADFDADAPGADHQDTAPRGGDRRQTDQGLGGQELAARYLFGQHAANLRRLDGEAKSAGVEAHHRQITAWLPPS